MTANTIDASPRGPNHPTNPTVGSRVCDLSRAIATGSVPSSFLGCAVNALFDIVSGEIQTGIVSNLGTLMQSVGAAWLIGDLGGTAAEVALVQTMTFLPAFLVGIPAGILDIGTLADLSNIGTLFAFVLVSAGVIILRFRE